jgi:hypothetical protein
MKLGLTFIAALLAKSATPSLAKGTRRVAAAAEEPAVAGGDQPDVAAMAVRPFLVTIEPKKFGALLIEYQAKTGDGVIDYLNCVNEGNLDSECQTEAMRVIMIATKEFFLGCGCTISVLGILLAGMLDGYN